MRAREFKKSLQNQEVTPKQKIDHLVKSMGKTFPMTPRDVEILHEFITEGEIKARHRKLAMFRFLIALLIVLACVAFYFSDSVSAQTLGDGIPEADRINTEQRLITYEVGGQNVFDYATFPTLIRDFGTVPFISNSPNDPNRGFASIPSFSLARWHWWLFGFDVLPRAQRQFAEVIAEIKTYQKILGEPVMIDDPKSPFYDNIIAVREYLVPFEPVQSEIDPIRLMPAKETQIGHLIAAVASVNVTVFFKGIYQGIAIDYKRKALEKVKGDYFQELRKQFKMTPIKKKK